MYKLKDLIYSTFFYVIMLLSLAIFVLLFVRKAAIVFDLSMYSMNILFEHKTVATRSKLCTPFVINRDWPQSKAFFLLTRVRIRNNIRRSLYLKDFIVTVVAVGTTLTAMFVCTISYIRVRRTGIKYRRRISDRRNFYLIKPYGVLRFYISER